VSREFKGLEPRYGMDEPAALEEGRRGIARGYEEER
jgi:diphthamide biosynthesis protein 2